MNYLQRFIENGFVYRSNKYDFILLKDLIEFVRRDKLDIKIRELKELLAENGWKQKKASISTTDGYQSKDIWYINHRVEKTRSLPVEAITRNNLPQSEEQEATRVLNEIFNNPALVLNNPVPEVEYTEGEILFTNKGLKLLLERFEAKGSSSKLSSIIRNKAEKIYVGGHYLGNSSRTILFKNYYKIKRG